VTVIKVNKIRPESGCGTARQCPTDFTKEFFIFCPWRIFDTQSKKIRSKHFKNITTINPLNTSLVTLPYTDTIENLKSQRRLYLNAVFGTSNLK